MTIRPVRRLPAARQICWRAGYDALRSSSPSELHPSGMMRALRTDVILRIAGCTIEEGWSMTQTAQTRTADMVATEGVLVLGLDAERPGSGRLARHIEHRSSGRVVVRDLADPQLRSWHAGAFGAGSAAAPTLFEVKGGSVRAWEGWRMGLALGRVLGPAVSQRIMRDLKDDGGGPPSPERPTSPLATRRPDPRTLSRSRELSGPELASAVLRASENPDVKNLAGRSLSSPAKLAAARPIAFEHVLRGGARVQATVFKLSVTRLLAHHLSTETSHPRPHSTARLWRADGDRSLLAGISDGGQVQPTPENLGTQYPGGDRGVGATCTAIDLSCVLNLAEAGGGCSTFFYTLPETSVRPAPPGGACAGGYRKPSRRCCATFGR